MSTLLRIDDHHQPAGGQMIIEELLQGRPVANFMEEYFLRLPFALPGGATRLISLGSRSVLEAVCQAPEADVLFARRGEAIDLIHREPAELFDRQSAEGYTALIRHAERHDARLAELARMFERDFHAPADVHLYATPVGEYGFGWHYDAEDVFLLQTEGRKEYRLRKNTVNPWPVVQAMPADRQFERELMPIFACQLEPGDWLYVPHGYWHYGLAQSDSITLAVGLMTPTGVDLLGHINAPVHASMRWRQRLPCTGPPTGKTVEQVSEEYHERLCALADELSELLTSPALARALVQIRISQFSPREQVATDEPNLRADLENAVSNGAASITAFEPASPAEGRVSR